MIRQPTLETRRLRLRPFELRDTDAVKALASDEAVARNTLNVPHPYTQEDAQSWITSHPDQLRRGEAVTFAVLVRGDAVAPDELVGAVGLILDLAHERAELGYWIGKPYWGRGYATEAAAAVVAWGFESLELHRIHAGHFARNPASGRVLQKLGMRQEGVAREHVWKWDERLDLVLYGILRHERQS
jgi:[ribosomal protein S5]-alanine N-acetyltransferase